MSRFKFPWFVGSKKFTTSRSDSNTLTNTARASVLTSQYLLKQYWRLYTELVHTVERLSMNHDLNDGKFN